MDSVAIRVFTFSILPVIIAAGHLGVDSNSRRYERRLEIFLLYLFGISVAGRRIGGFFGHVFISDSVAESIGWPTGDPWRPPPRRHPVLRPDYFATYGRPRPAETALRTALSPRLLKDEVTGSSPVRPTTPPLTSGNAEDLAAAKRWYESEVDQAAKRLREGAAHLRVVAVQGVDDPPG